MCEHQKKADVLKTGGYRFDYGYCTYVNRRLKVIFSVEFTDSRSPEELEACIAEVAPRPEWQFFCLKPPLEATREELVAAYS
ncbi:MAG TPA: hypothetical protein VGO53_08190 [Steroidobacteraceae bacterium]|jgi:hypothetical protein|nr:hypothetical protein [Steroidobacteraceae bacterium]